MELAARRYIRKVLLIHGALLLLLLAAVALAVGYLYNSARQQAIDHAADTQRLLTRQTAVGIANYYRSVTGVLELMVPTEEETADETRREANRPNRPPNEDPNRRQGAAQDVRRRVLDSGPGRRMLSGMGQSMWLSIQDKATMLFAVDPQEQFKLVATFGDIDEKQTPEEVIERVHAWLKPFKSATVSPLLMLPGGPAHVIAVPMRGPGGLMMLCVVPVYSLQRDVLNFLNSDDSFAAFVFDSDGAVIASGRRSDGKIVNVNNFPEPRIREMILDSIRNQRARTEVVDNLNIPDPNAPSAILMTVQPAEVFETQWFISISSRLDAIEAVVKPIFRDAMIWAGFLMLAITGIFISTAVHMIRSRMKVDRAQMEAMSRELEQARQIQLNWLPAQPYRFKSIEIAALNKPASHVSGDFYNWFELPDGRIAIAIGDVTGHGMSAAFLMATTQFLLRAIVQRVPDPGRALMETNKHICTMTFSGQFVTLLLIVLDLEKGEAQAASAGHFPPLVCTNGRFKSFDIDTDLVLGVDAAQTYRTYRMKLEADSSLLLYTDGVIEAAAPDGQRLTLNGLTESLKRRDPSDLIRQVTDRVTEFCCGIDPSDDLTLVAVGIKR